MKRCAPIFVVLLLTAEIASATVFEKLSDRQLVDRSDAVVIGIVRDAFSRQTSDGLIVTDSHLIIEEALKGNVPDTLTITEVGGVVGTRFTMVADSARYAPGERVMAFLRRRDDGTFFTTSMALGKFTFARTERGETVVVRQASELGDEPARLLEPFTGFVRDLGRGETAKTHYLSTGATSRLPIAPNGTAKQYALIDPNNLPVRWPTSTVTFRVTGSLSFSATNGINNGMGAWTNDPASTINLVNGGTSTSSAPSTTDGTNVIYLGYGGSVTGVCDASLGCALLSGTTSHTFDGDTWDSLGDTDIVIRSSVLATQFDAVMTHELGHAIGIRHSDQGAPSTSAAIMAASVPATFGSNLQQWDKDAVDSLYGSGPVCQAPQIISVSGGGTVTSGTSVTLGVSATGTSLSYQWYDGMSGDFSTPVGTNSPSFTTPPITTTKNYWVNVFNTCGSAPSSTITLTPQACQKPQITVDPQSQTIAAGGSTTLVVGASGSQPLLFQWYQGQPPDVSNPVLGANGSQFTTPPLTQTTFYWVRASNSCGSADSKAATITIPGTCTGPEFTLQPSGVTIDPGQQTYLIAAASNATSYQWYQGTAPDTSSPLTGIAPSNARYVNQLYIDLLRRQADAGASTFTSLLDSNAATRPQVALLILNSNEYRSNLISSAYTAYLHRGAAAAEVTFWLPSFAAGITDEQFAAQILGSAEYFGLAANTNSTWIANVYTDVLGRAPSAAESSFWLNALGSGSRTTVAQLILTSSEARTKLVQGWFSSFLRRNATATQLSSFVSSLAGGARDEQVMSLILGSDEYFSFGTMLPTGALSSTTSYWVIANNADCSTNSSTATVTIRTCDAPVITQQPQNVTIGVGGAPSLSVGASGVGSLSYQWYQGNTSDTSRPLSGATSATLAGSPIDAVGSATFWVRVTNSCKSTDSAAATVTVTCSNGPAILVTAPPSAPSSQGYTVTLTTRSSVYSKFELQEASASDFSNATTLTSTSGTFNVAAHPSITVDTRFYYRARGFLACSSTTPTSYSPSSSTLVRAPQVSTGPINTSTPGCTTLIGTPCTISGGVTGTFTTTGKTALDLPVTYTVTSDKPWITFSPSSGTVPDSGSVTVTYTVDLNQLTTGSTEASITFTFTPQSSKGVTALGGTTQTVPVSISLVTPVTPKPKDSNAPPNTVIVPAIAHADGINSQFQSDVRITNTAPQPITYQLTYTPSNTDGTVSGKQSSITVDAGETKALNDIVKNWYGSGSLGEAGVGTLEIRPMNYAGKTGVNVSFATVASSRTYNTTSNGTFGQYIPAIPLIDFLAKSDLSKISLQQVAQSSAYRSNLGFVEGAGQPIEFVVTLYDDKNNPVGVRPYSLKPFEHQQTSLSNFFPGVSVTDGRIEVKVTSDTGKLSAYASVLDNTTSDPLLVFPVDPSTISASRFVVPGVAELNNGPANFHTDMRIYNGSASSTNVTLTFPANSSLPPVQKQLAAGEVWAIDNVLPTLWKTTGGGAVIATTDSDAPLVVTARTFSRRDDGGTFGQFIPGVTATDAVGVGDHPLQVVQLEQSPAFRSNVGLVEVTGNPVTLDVAGYVPESKVAAHTQVTLAPGQFIQLGSIFLGLGFTSNVYNGRVAVTAVGGTGRVAAYGSVIDNRTQDPTYVPAQ